MALGSSRTSRCHRLRGTIGVPASDFYHAHRPRPGHGITTPGPGAAQAAVVDGPRSVYSFLHTLTLEGPDARPRLQQDLVQPGAQASRRSPPSPAAMARVLSRNQSTSPA
ncbi:hypothetical protein HBB16_15400 [Pseudonocardia sp. MCCB 268]|nr:hypothetical protein [Pseudonocardia cytotoxica]